MKNSGRSVAGQRTLVDLDPWLENHRYLVLDRINYFDAQLAQIESAVESLDKMSLGHKYFGFNRGEYNGNAGVWYREWAPGALSLALIGDFNGWERFRHPMKKDEFGTWSIFLSDEEYKDKLVHGSKVKVFVSTKDRSLDRIPTYITKVVQEKDHSFSGIYWQPEKGYVWKQKSIELKGNLRIYEAHVGMAQEKYGEGTFDEFTQNILPRIKSLGYNAIQLMALAQHPYYASFGYQVSSFFAVSHYFGDPDQLKKLVDTAHEMGIVVLMDLVHSHTVKNFAEGLNEFDGTVYQYFHAGPQGNHPGWDTKLFNYGKFEVLRFLLSNVRFWMEEYGFDGFRFDGVTSMIYKDHGLGGEFDHYDRYFDENVDKDAVVYLQLANELIHQINPNAITIAEEVSGMPGMARPVAEGGLGFDYRLAMGLPDYWIKLLKHSSDEQWNLEALFNTLLERRRHEKHVAYAESHDQALVGDKTIAFWLMDAAMYHDMAIDRQNPVIDRGVALHKMIRLVTFAVGGEAYLNFIGNEFGHPEWIDFPREGNGDSFQYARRQWSLVDNKLLRYQFLNDFDRAMQQLTE